MWDYLASERGVSTETIVLWGRSLGGGPTVDLAREAPCKAVILESTFLSTRDVARDQKSTRLLRGLIRHRFENKAKVGDITSPLLILHSPDDEVIAYHHGVDLYTLATPPKYFLEIQGGHNTGPQVSGAAYQDGIAHFLAHGSLPE